MGETALFFKIGSFDDAKAIIIAYFLCSIFLSLTICIRLLFPINVALINVIMYWILFCVIPIFTVSWIFYKHHQQKHVCSKLFLFILFPIIIICLMITFFIPSILGHLFLCSPVFAMAILYAKQKDVGKGFLKTRNSFLLVSLLIIMLLPHLMAYVCINILLNRVASMSNEQEKAFFISRRVMNMTAFGWVPEAGTDFWKFVLSGAGSCGEMAVVGTRLMNDAGLVARVVAFPGEDHAFIEVKINGEWLVADPGYYSGNIMTRLERASKRISEFGAISYVIAPADSSFIELTQEYVPTDTVIIRVTLGGEPLANAQVVLKHRFMSKEFSLPTFYTDMNGTVTLHLGAMDYNDKAKEYEPYYRIFVEGKDTGFRATSTGTGQIQYVEIYLGS